MSALDLDDFGSLWREEGGPAADAEPLARRTIRRGRLLQYAEIGTSALLLAAIAIALLFDATPATAAIVALIAAATLWSSWKRHLLMDLAMLIDDSDHAAYLASAVRGTRAQLRRANVGLALFFPGVLLGALLKHSLERGGDIGAFLPTLWRGLSGVSWILAAVLIAAALFAWLVRGNLRLRAELRELEQMRADYEHEAALDRSAA